MLVIERRGETAGEKTGRSGDAQIGLLTISSDLVGVAVVASHPKLC